MGLQKYILILLLLQISCGKYNPITVSQPSDLEPTPKTQNLCLESTDPDKVSDECKKFVQPQSCDGVTHGTVENRIRYKSSNVPFGQKCEAQAQNRICKNGKFSDWVGDFTAMECSVNPEVVCNPTTAANCASCGSVLHNGTESKDFYPTETVPFGQTCKADTRTRTCNNGAFGAWSGPTNFDKCSELSPANCGAILHGEKESKIFYPSATVPFGSTCVGSTRTRECFNGALGSWSASSNTFESCKPLDPAKCGTANSGETETKTFYSATSVPFGTSCTTVKQDRTRTCNNGTWSAYNGSTSFQYETCATANPLGCSGGYAHNATESKTFYPSTSVPFGQTCVGTTRTRLCNNGTWGAWSASTNTAESCAPLPGASCPSAGLAHNQEEKKIFYLTDSVPYLSTCQSEERIRKCFNGTVSAWSGSYTFAACTPQAPASCDGTPHGQSVTQPRFAVPSVPSGEICPASQNQSRSCNNGVWSAWTGGTYEFNTCISKSIGNLQSISMGNISHACGLTKIGGLKCWGDNRFGQLGLGQNTITQIPSPRTVTLPEVKQVSVGGYFTCVLLTDNTVRCTGNNPQGQLGLGHLNGMTSFTQIPGLQAKQISSGAYHACAIMMDDTVKCWGSNSLGGLGINNVNVTSTSTPITVPGIIAKKITSGGSVWGGTTCAILMDDSVKCWGNNRYGQAGVNVAATTESILVPTTIANFKAKEIAIGSMHACAITLSNTIQCWGEGGSGQINKSKTTDAIKPTAIHTTKTASQVTVGETETCAMWTDGTYECFGALSKNTIANTKQIYAGAGWVCAVLTNDFAKCWGSNHFGQLGMGTVSGATTAPATIGFD